MAIKKLDSPDLNLDDLDLDDKQPFNLNVFTKIKDLFKNKVVLYGTIGAAVAVVVLVVLLFSLSGTETLPISSGTNEFTFSSVEGGQNSFRAGTESHNIKILSIVGDTVTFEISSDPVTVSVKVGEKKLVDINGDGVSDVELGVSDIKNGKVTYNVKVTKVSTGSKPSSSPSTQPSTTKKSTAPTYTPATNLPAPVIVDKKEPALVVCENPDKGKAFEEKYLSSTCTSKGAKNKDSCIAEIGEDEEAPEDAEIVILNNKQYELVSKSEQLLEYACGTDGCTSSIVDCEDGCFSGACVAPCKDTDVENDTFDNIPYDGINSYSPGSITFGATTAIDKCATDKKTLTEYFCEKTDEGVWQVSNKKIDCSTSCSNGGCKCTNAEVQCAADGNIYECLNGEWKTVKKCNAGCVTKEGGGFECRKCIPDAVWCGSEDNNVINETLFTCSETGFEISKTICADHCDLDDEDKPFCVGGEAILESCGAANVGALLCAGDMTRVCQSTQGEFAWSDPQNCEDIGELPGSTCKVLDEDQPTDHSECVAPCENDGDTLCSSDFSLKICKGKLWINYKHCPLGCVGEAGSADCVDNIIRGIEGACDVCAEDIIADLYAGGDGYCMHYDLVGSRGITIYTKAESGSLDAFTESYRVGYSWMDSCTGDNKLIKFNCESGEIIYGQKVCPVGTTCNQEKGTCGCTASSQCQQNEICLNEECVLDNLPGISACIGQNGEVDSGRDQAGNELGAGQILKVTDQVSGQVFAYQCGTAGVRQYCDLDAKACCSVDDNGVFMDCAQPDQSQLLGKICYSNSIGWDTNFVGGLYNYLSDLTLETCQYGCKDDPDQSPRCAECDPSTIIDDYEGGCQEGLCALDGTCIVDRFPGVNNGAIYGTMSGYVSGFHGAVMRIGSPGELAYLCSDDNSAAGYHDVHAKACCKQLSDGTNYIYNCHQPGDDLLVQRMCVAGALGADLNGDGINENALYWNVRDRNNNFVAQNALFCKDGCSPGSAVCNCALACEDNVLQQWGFHCGWQGCVDSRENYCAESDAGDNPLVSGSTVIPTDDAQTSIRYDVCGDDGVLLTEYYCSQGTSGVVDTVGSRIYQCTNGCFADACICDETNGNLEDNCPQGYTCDNGTCIQQQANGATSAAVFQLLATPSIIRDILGHALSKLVILSVLF